MSLLWWLIPDEAMVLVVAAIGLALILGLMTRSSALSILALLGLAVVAAPFVELLLVSLPWWVSVLFLLWFVVAILRGGATLFLGRRAANAMVGDLAARVVWLCFGLLFLPLRIAWRALRRT